MEIYARVRRAVLVEGKSRRAVARKPSGFDFEVDQHIPQHESVDGRKRRPWSGEIHLPELDHLPNLPIKLPLGAARLEVLREKSCWQATTGFHLRVTLFAGAFQSVKGDICGYNVESPTR